MTSNLVDYMISKHPANLQHRSPNRSLSDGINPSWFSKLTNSEQEMFSPEKNEF